jgi:hypothetical protein
MAQQFGRVGFEQVYRGVIAENVVTDPRLCHGSAHISGWCSDSITTKVNELGGSH